MKRLVSATAALALFAIPTLASASTVMLTQSDTVPLQSTNWSTDLSFDLFDPSLGELCEVKITLEGTVEGDASYESLDAQPALISLDLQATIELGSLVEVIPLVNVVDSASAFDGTIDFGGTSGDSFLDLQGGDMDMVVLTDPLDLADFIGVGSIVLPVEATGASTGSGAGNLITQFATEASAGVTVKYTYKPAVPEPTSAVVLALGGLGLVGVRRRR